jgi:hypothetical protein
VEIDETQVHGKARVPMTLGGRSVARNEADGRRDGRTRRPGPCARHVRTARLAFLGLRSLRRTLVVAVESLGHVIKDYGGVIPNPGMCVWGCGRRSFNREHIIGNQVVKALGMPEDTTLKWGKHRERNRGRFEVVLPDRVCQECNAKWMRKLDNRMMGFMRNTLMTGAPVELTTTRQLTLAYWATKVALLNEVYLHDENERKDVDDVGVYFAPDDNLHAVYKYNRPPKLTRVWVGSRADTPEALFFIHTTGIVVPEPDRDLATFCIPEYKPENQYQRQRGFSSMFALRHLVFLVRGWELSYEAGDLDGLGDPDADAPDSMLPIWPNSAESVHWPPPHQLSTDEIGQITGTPPEWVE